MNRPDCLPGNPETCRGHVSPIHYRRTLGENRAPLERRISLDHCLQCFLVAAVAAVAVGMVKADELGIAGAKAAAVDVEIEAEHAQMPAVALADLAPVGAHPRPPVGEARADRVERVDEIGPARRRRSAGGAEGAGLAVPAAIGVLGLADLVCAHPLEIIIARIERADMIEAEPAPVARPVETGPVRAGRAELAGRVAAGLGADLRPPFDPSVKPLARARQTQLPFSSDPII